MNYKSIPSRNLTGKSWTIDTHVMDHPDAADLIRMYKLSWIYLQTPDTVFSELSTRKDETDREKLLDERSSFPMSMGIFILDRSNLDLAVLGSEEEMEKMKKIHSALWEGHTFSDDCRSGAEGNAKARSRAGDTMIIHTTMRYSIGTLVTNDMDLLEGAQRIREQVGNFQAWNIKSATTLAFEACKRVRTIRAAQPERQWEEELPDWPV